MREPPHPLGFRSMMGIPIVSIIVAVAMVAALLCIGAADAFFAALFCTHKIGNYGRRYGKDNQRNYYIRFVHRKPPFRQG